MARNARIQEVEATFDESKYYVICLDATAEDERVCIIQIFRGGSGLGDISGKLLGVVEIPLSELVVPGADVTFERAFASSDGAVAGTLKFTVNCVDSNSPDDPEVSDEDLSDNDD
jgi:hypothetical protein